MIGLAARGGVGIGLARQRGGGVLPLSVEDSFNGANGTNLNGRTPDTSNTPENTWSAVLQSWIIISNRARGADFLQSLLVIDCGAADGTITMPCARGGGRNGIVFRYVDNSNYWRAEHSSLSGRFAIIEITGGTETSRASIADTSTTVLTMTVTLSGNSISANWNGNTLTYTSSTRATATKHGIYRQDFQDSAIADWWKMVA